MLDTRITPQGPWDGIPLPKVRSDRLEREIRVDDGTATITRRGVRDLIRYDDLLRQELVQVESTEAEARLLVDALDRVLGGPVAHGHVWKEVHHAVYEEGFADKWGVDGPVLVMRLKALSPTQNLAVIAAVERVWTSPSYRVEITADLLREVGLIR